MGEEVDIDDPTPRLLRYVGCSDYQANWGGCDDPRTILESGTIYHAAKFEVHSSHTKVKLTGLKGLYNSVCFEEVADREVEDAYQEYVRMFKA